MNSTERQSRTREVAFASGYQEALADLNAKLRNEGYEAALDYIRDNMRNDR